MCYYHWYVSGSPVVRELQTIRYWAPALLLYVPEVVVSGEPYIVIKVAVETQRFLHVISVWKVVSWFYNTMDALRGGMAYSFACGRKL